MAEEVIIQQQPTEDGEKKFTQAELDTIISRRLGEERKKYPTAEEISAYNTWKAEHQTDEQKLNDAIRAKDDAQKDLASVQSELTKLKNLRYVESKGISGEEAEFIAYKAAKMVDDKTSFEKAVDSLAKNRNKPKPRVDWAAPVSGGIKKDNANDMMNALIRGALR